MKLIQSLLCLGAFLAVEYSTPTAGLRLTNAITFPNVFTSAMLVTVDNKLLVGGKMGDGLSGLVSIDLLQPTSAQSVPHAPGTVHSMALLSDGDLMVTRSSGDVIAEVLDLDGENGGEEEKVRINSGVNATWYMVASIPPSSSSSGADSDSDTDTNNDDDDEKIIVSFYNRDTEKTSIGVMSRDGDVIEHLTDDLDGTLNYLVVRDGDLYLSLWEVKPALMRFNMATKTSVPNIGRLDLASAFGSDYEMFTQGGFDRLGNLYIGADRGCDSMRLRPRGSSCGHVMRISPAGEVTVVVPRLEGRVDHEYLHLQSVTVTPRGIAAAYVAYRPGETEGVVRLYEF